VRKAKGELFDHLRTIEHGYAIVMWDYQYLQQMSKGISGIIKYGTAGDAHVIGKVLSSDPFLEVEITQGMDEKKISTQLVGDYNLPNVLAAVATGKLFNVPEKNIRRSIENYVPSNSRSQLLDQGSNKIILDAYNANPSSMKLAIENFSKFPGEKILILGSMAEMGNESEKEHLSLIELIKKTNWKDVVLVGKEFEKIKHPFHQFKNSDEAGSWLQQQNFENSSMLIKGSRSMQMEKVLSSAAPSHK
jgi:UDP-N-acetylmuramoyl-tripeptide--D-alanyl-D-alanine ligase